MNAKWVKIITLSNKYQIEVLKSKLISEGIDAVVMNKQDSMLHPINNTQLLELLVQSEDVIRAKHIIEKANE